MSDEPLDPRDARASDLLDGVEAPDEVLDAEVAGRLAALRAARDAVRAPVPPAPEAAREAALAAALEAFEPAAGRPPVAGSGDDRADQPALAAVTPLRWAARNPRWLGAAAAVVALALGVAVVLGGTSPDPDDTAARAAVDEAGPEAGTFSGEDEAVADQAPTALSEEAADLDAPATSVLRAAGVDLGSHPDLDRLAETVLSTLDDDPPTRGAGDASEPQIAVAPDPCEAMVTGLVGEGALELDGTALLADAAVRVLVVQPPDEPRTLLVLDPAAPSCPVVDRRVLP